MDLHASVDPASRPLFSDVVVLLGDGRLADRSHIESRFGATEFEAIKRLQAIIAAAQQRIVSTGGAELVDDVASHAGHARLERERN